MTKTTIFNWPDQDTAAIAALQTVGAGASMNLNGTLKKDGNPVITLVGISRKISLTSGANLSGVNFTITGTYLGKPQSETIAGPDNDSVETTTYFNTISSVTAATSTGANTVSVGTGSDGHTNPYLYDPFASVCALSAHVILGSGSSGNVTYTFQSTCQDVNEPTFTINNGVSTIYNMNNATGTNVMGAHGTLTIVGTGDTPPDYNIPVYTQLPIKYCWIFVSTNLGTTPAALTAYITQQGIN